MAENNSSTISETRQTIPFPRHVFFKNLTGQRFGRLSVQTYTGKIGKNRISAWLCRCDCGRMVTVRATSLQEGTQSCGCLHREILGDINRTHGKSKSAEYRIWCHLRERCENTKCVSYVHYGMRGIRVSPEWSRSFEQFMADMGLRPGPRYEIDRINNNGDYKHGNCRWTTKTQNARNKRSNRILSHDGKRMCISQWAELLGMRPYVITNRLLRGWSVVRALSTPTQKAK